MQNNSSRIVSERPIVHGSSFSFQALPSLRGNKLALSSWLRRHHVLFGISLTVLTLIGCDHARGQSATEPVSNAAPARASINKFITEASRRFGIPENWIADVMQTESNGDAHAESFKGAMGLMQLMPETWADLRQRYHLGADPEDAHDNIIAGTAYLRELYDRYGSAGFLAAYNAGPERWEDHLAKGEPLPEETQVYLAHLLPTVGGGVADGTVDFTAMTTSWNEGSLFPPHSAMSSTDVPAAQAPSSSEQSTDHSVQDWTALAPQSEGLFIALSDGERAQ